MTQNTSLVQRLISFLKKPDALEQQTRRVNAYDDYTERVYQEPAPVNRANQWPFANQRPIDQRPPDHRDLIGTNARAGDDASRLDALVMRAIHQFNAHRGYVLRCDTEGDLRYCTGRDHRGRYIAPGDAHPDRRAMFLTLDSGESQLFVHTPQGQTPISVLCGPLWSGDEMIGVLYIDNPSRSQLHRGMFDMFCEQVSRLLCAGIA
ncbi:MAG: hypothetical protein JXQ72_10075 [Anaerolineae bacterium]|nr:hypothetical protein [Anaerolineae bacterium]